MAIQLDPSRVRLNSGTTERRRTSTGDGTAVVVPSRAHVNHVPAPDSLMTLISSAVAALKRGVRWDRGTILNLLV